MYFRAWLHTLCILVVYVYICICFKGFMSPLVHVFPDGRKKPWGWTPPHTHTHTHTVCVCVCVRERVYMCVRERGCMLPRCHPLLLLFSESERGSCQVSTQAKQFPYQRMEHPQTRRSKPVCFRSTRVYWLQIVTTWAPIVFIYIFYALDLFFSPSQNNNKPKRQTHGAVPARIWEGMFKWCRFWWGTRNHVALRTERSTALRPNIGNTARQHSQRRLIIGLFI